MRTIKKLAGKEGFEPSLLGPEPGVLPLDYSPTRDVCHVHDITQSKCRRFFRGVNGLLPLILPQKRAGIGQLIHSLLPGPLTSTLGQVPFRVPVKGGFAGNATEVVFLLHSAAPLSEYPRLKYQPSKAGLVGTILPFRHLKRYAEIPKTAWPPVSLYIMTDNANETPLLLATLTMSPLTLPEYKVEVLLRRHRQPSTTFFIPV